MTQQLLDGANVVTILEQMCGKAVAKSVAAAILMNFGQVDGPFHGALDMVGLHVMPTLFT